MVLHDGAVLLRENAFSKDSTRWTMFLSTGEVTGQFTLPGTIQILGGSSNRLLLNSPSELGVPTIAWHRVEGVMR